MPRKKLSKIEKKQRLVAIRQKKRETYAADREAKEDNDDGRSDACAARPAPLPPDWIDFMASKSNVALYCDESSSSDEYMDLNAPSTSTAMPRRKRLANGSSTSMLRHCNTLCTVMICADLTETKRACHNPNGDVADQTSRPSTSSESNVA